MQNLHLLSTVKCIQTKVRWRFRKILWPSQNIWTLIELVHNLIIIFYNIYQLILNYNSSDSKNLQIKRYIPMYLNLISTCHINECRQKLLARRRTLKQRKKRSKTKTNNICHNHNWSLCQRTTTTYLLIPWRMFKVRRSVFASLLH